MRLIPVLDLLHGVVVHAVAGQRDQYQPLTSSMLTRSTEPAAVARALLTATGANELYVADLDAILRQGSNWPVIAALLQNGVRIWLDAGIRQPEDLQTFPDSPLLRLLAGTETMQEPTRFPFNSTPLAVSIDLQGGELLGCWRNLPGVQNARDIPSAIDWFFQQGVRRFVLLDLQAVGGGGGPILIEWCREIKARWPEVELLTGGGIRHAGDVTQLQNAGVDGVLVASALHQGRFGM